MDFNLTIRNHITKENDRILGKFIGLYPKKWYICFMKNKVKFSTESPKTIKEFLQSQKLTWVYNPDEEQDEDFAFFFFQGKYKNKEVIFDVAFFPLSVHYASIIEEQAEEEVKKLYPEYEGEESNLPQNKLEEILEHKAEIIAEMEAESDVKVQEFIEFDDDFEEGDEIVLLTVSLNIDEVNEEEVSKFVENYLNNTFKLDENLYSFSLEEED